MMKKSATPRKVTSFKMLPVSIRRKKTPNMTAKGLNIEVKPEEILSNRFKSQNYSCKASKNPVFLKSSKELLPQTARVSPKSTSTPILHRTKSSPYESKLARPKAIAALIKVKKIITKDQKSKSLKHKFQELISQVDLKIYDLPEKMLTNKEIKQRHKEIHQAHLYQTFHGLKLIDDLPKLNISEINDKLLNLPTVPGCEGRKTVVFDLDETLVHCVESTKGDVDVTVVFPTGEKIDVIPKQVGINIRPFARECLSEASQIFEVVVFTASHRCYADAVMDHLDPENRLIHHRLYRENCLIVKGMHIKDLRVLRNRNIANIVIVDNAVHSFAYHIDNGIPIITWHNDRYDRELYKLIDYLKLLASTADICQTNKKTFKLSSFSQDFLTQT
jgi:Dullard-like phosphatase family protein